MRELALNAQRGYCDKIRMKVRRYEALLPEDSDI